MRPGPSVGRGAGRGQHLGPSALWLQPRGGMSRGTRRPCLGGTSAGKPSVLGCAGQAPANSRLGPLPAPPARTSARSLLESFWEEQGFPEAGERPRVSASDGGR